MPPRLVAAWPMPGASVSPGRQVFELVFNRRLASAATTAGIWREDDGVPIAAGVAVDPGNPRRLTVRMLEPSAGRYTLHWHAVAAGSSAASDGAQGFSMQDESPSPPRLDVSPSVAEVGARLERVGKGFTAQAELRLTIGDDDQPLATTETDAKGGFNLEARVPAWVPFGVQPVTATDGQGRLARAAVAMHWGGWPPLIAGNVAQPGPGPGEVTFALNLRNRSDYVLEHVDVVLQDPPDGTLVGADPGARHQDGSVIWDIPVMDRGVAGPFRAIYRVAGQVAGHAWIDFRHRRERGCQADTCLGAFISGTAADSSPVEPAPD
jgi:hypothetical protein